MARYLVLRVESDDSADLLMSKFDPHETIEVIGLFYAGAKFCECAADSSPQAKKHGKFGIWYCPVCKRARQSNMQHPKNLLYDNELHPRYRDLFISVWEPPCVDPRMKYGEREVEASRMTLPKRNAIRERIRRAKRNRARKVRRQEDGG